MVYIRKELENELTANPNRYFELKAYCNEFSDIGEIPILVAMLSILIGYVSELEKGSIIFCAFLLSIIAICLPTPYKKCKFVFDNMDIKELEKIVEENISDENAENMIIGDYENMVNEIEELKQRWINKEIPLAEVSYFIEKLLDEVKEESSYKKISEYIRSLIIIDNNVEKSEALIFNSSIAFVPIVLTINSLILVQNKNEKLSYLYLGLTIILQISIGFIYFTIVKKHIGTHARERSFYEIMQEYMEKYSKKK